MTPVCNLRALGEQDRRRVSSEAVMLRSLSGNAPFMLSISAFRLVGGDCHVQDRDIELATRATRNGTGRFGPGEAKKRTRVTGATPHRVGKTNQPAM